MRRIQGKMLLHVSEAVLKRHAAQRNRIFGPEGYHVEWRHITGGAALPPPPPRAPGQGTRFESLPASLTFDFQVAASHP